MEKKKVWSVPELYSLGISSTELLNSGTQLDCTLGDTIEEDQHGRS